MKYTEIEVHSFHREDFYLAQIAAEVRRSIAKDPTDVQIKDFLLTFEAAKKEKAPPTEDQKALKLEASKAYWLNLPAPKKPPKKDK